jgi:RHS repeat-associated protein
MSIYTYSTPGGNRQTVVETGAPEGDWAASVTWSPATPGSLPDGTRTTTVVGTWGEPLLSETEDIKANLLIDQQTFDNYDDLKRGHRVLHLDGTAQWFYYACCGLSSTIDRDGVQTDYFYDDARRQNSTRRLNITLTNLLDAAGNVLQTTRIGTNGGAGIIISQAAFDLGGQLTRQTNALNGVTSFGLSYIGGQTLSVTNPDGGTSITVNNQEGTLSSVTGTAVAPFRKVYGIATDASISRAYVADIKLNSSYADTSETQTNFADMLGRQYKTTYAAASAPYPTATTGFNVRGQMSSQVDPDGVAMLYLYNQRGDMEYSVLDSNRNSSVDWSGSDRITFTTNDVFQSSGIWDNAVIQRSRTYVWTETGTVLSRESWSTTNGIRRADMAFGLTNETRTVYAGSGLRYVTNTAPDGTRAIATYINGRLTLSSNWNAQVSNLGWTSYSYDAHGRRDSMTDARNGKTTFYFNPADKQNGELTPSPDGAQAGQLTTNYFDTSGRVWKTTLPDNTSLTNEYYATGLLRRRYGSREYPTAYSYDAQKRMKSTTNWSNFSAGSGARVTSWNYNAYRGWLENKQYADATGPSYTYTAGGRLASRTWARGVVTTYAYNLVGQLAGVTYSDSTPALSYSYDRRGRENSIVNGTAACTLARNDANLLIGESYTGGPLDGITISNRYDEFLRRTNLSTFAGSTPMTVSQYAYDPASRLLSAADSTNSAAYAYIANSPLVSQISFTNNGAWRMTTTKIYDKLNRLTQIASLPSGSSPISFAYAYNAANQRTAMTNADNSFWAFQQDTLGQVTSGKKYWPDGWPVAGEQFQYSFDDIGNRATSAQGGDQWGANLKYSTYAANTLNQYTSRTAPGYIQVLGSANSNATVTVNNQTAYRHGEFFRAELPGDNSAGPVYVSLTNLAVLQNGTDSDYAATNIGNLFLPQTPENLGYDLDGNMTNDGRWFCRWDAENRLVEMSSLPGAPSGSKILLDFAYDHEGRRIQKTISTNNGAGYFPQSTNKFAYDGWNLLIEFRASNILLRSFVWGLDLAGSVQDGGGVGGLLTFAQYSGGTVSDRHFAAFDGNGNVMGLVSGTDGTLSGLYEYGSFGEELRTTGTAAKANPFRFSTKYHDSETGLVYFGRRFYVPDVGEWLNRDPAEETGGLNLYAFNDGDAINRWDALGEGPGTDKQQPAWKVYCDAAQKHPDSSWLQCACKVSHEINQFLALIVVTAPSVQDPAKSGAVGKWLICTRSCILKKFQEFYKVYDAGASMSDVNLTPYWKKACGVCVGKSEAKSEKECCKVMVVAEQNAIEDCKTQCGNFPGNSTAMGRVAPGFTGDFSKLEDRINYGFKRCCKEQNQKDNSSQQK